MNENERNDNDIVAAAEKIRRRRRLTAWVLAAVLVLGSNAAFFALGRYSSRSDGYGAADEQSALAIQKLLYIKRNLENNFLFEMDEAAMWEAATSAFVAATGDIYTSYLSSEDYEKYQAANEETFEGIGIQMQNTEEMDIFVVSVFTDSPAERAGLLPGDIITAADGESLLGRGIDYASSKLRGPAGTDVTVTLERDGSELEVLITRELISYNYVTSKMLDGDIGYIQMTGFENNGDTDFAKYLDSLREQGMKALIIDLRANPGGYVYVALNIADSLLGECELIYTMDKNGKKLAEYSDANALDLPIVVLIDENSASASEILAGTLQDNGGAVLLGAKSFGKGIIQQPVELSDGSYYKFTIQQYFLPSGAAVHGVGLTPDYEVPLADGKTDNQLERAIEVAAELAEEQKE